MIERIEGMPGGTIGLRASGKLSKADYTEVLEPALFLEFEPSSADHFAEVTLRRMVD